MDNWVNRIVIGEDFLEEVVEDDRLSHNLGKVLLFDVRSQLECFSLACRPIRQVEGRIEAAESCVDSGFEVPDVKEGDFVLYVQQNVDPGPVPFQVAEDAMFAFYSREKGIDILRDRVMNSSVPVQCH